MQQNRKQRLVGCFRGLSGRVFRDRAIAGSLPGSKRLLRVVSITATIVCLAAIVSLFLPVAAKAYLDSQDSVLVVSTRPKAEDAFYILAVRESSRLAYLRGDTDFARGLERAIPPPRNG